MKRLVQIVGSLLVGCLLLTSCSIGELKAERKAAKESKAVITGFLEAMEDYDTEGMKSYMHEPEGEKSKLQTKLNDLGEKFSISDLGDLLVEDVGGVVGEIGNQIKSKLQEALGTEEEQLDWDIELKKVKSKNFDAHSGTMIVLVEFKYIDKEGNEVVEETPYEFEMVLVKEKWYIASFEAVKESHS